MSLNLTENTNAIADATNYLESSISDISLKESKTNLIVNYLPSTITNDDLRTLFSSFGELQSSKLVFDKQTGQSLCYGFIDFVRVEDAQKAAKQLNGQKIQNKVIKVSFARPSCESIKGANLYVCGIPKHWTTTQLNAYFSQCGVIITSRILYNPLDGQSKCVAFIRYDQREEAKLAVKKLNNTLPPDSQERIIVKFANSFADYLSTASTPLQLYSTALTATLKPTQYIAPIFNLYQQQQQAIKAPTFTPITPYPPIHMPQRFTPTAPTKPLLIPSLSMINPPMLPTSTIQTAGGWLLFVYNLPNDLDDNILWELFCPFGAVQTVKLAKDKTSGVIKMTNYEDAIAALSAMNGRMFQDRILQVSFKTTKF